MTKNQKTNQEEFIKGREYERLYQLGTEKDNARKIVIKWFSGLSLEKSQLIASDVSELLKWLEPPKQTN